ncbi:MAG TPA: DUF6798 domain-containing protein [Acidobacteriota bacterium]|nr:DUF6798 domain-containing protein [Acidobacteriota bacterium]
MPPITTDVPQGDADPRSIRSAPTRWRIRLFLKYVAFPGLLFAIAYSQLPLYSDNQNTYFIHGLAHVDRPFLLNDALVQSPDPFPVFTALVTLTGRFLHPGFFHLYHMVLLGLYFAALIGIAHQLFRIVGPRGRHWLFGFLIIAVHSYVLHKALWLFQAGLAGQYLLGRVLQPSLFGVFLIVSIWLYLRNKLALATALACLATVFHSSYAPATAVLCLVYLGSAVRQRYGFAGVLGIILIPAALLGPVFAYNMITFAPTSDQTWQRAAEILVDYRIPHHAKPAIWFGWESAAQLILIGWATWLVRRKRLAPIMYVSIAVGLLLTLAQIVTGSRTLALLFPWRLSVYLIPLSTAIILATATQARLARPLFRRSSGERLRRVIWIGAITLAVIGAGRFVYLDVIKKNPREHLLEFVRQNASADDLYLIPLDWAEFRLATGARTFVDHKSHPYKDIDVTRWYSRITPASHFYIGVTALLVDYFATEHGVTHAIVPTDLSVQPSDEFREIYSDANFRILQIVEGHTPP